MCSNCGATDTSNWRRHPQTREMLCNGCGGWAGGAGWRGMRWVGTGCNEGGTGKWGEEGQVAGTLAFSLAVLVVVTVERVLEKPSQANPPSRLSACPT